MPRASVDLTGFQNPRFVKDVPFTLRTARKGVKADGVRYERKVQTYLESVFGDRYVPSPWIAFDQNGRRRFCQPDGLIFDIPNGRITIVEIKLRHTYRAYQQLARVYFPLLSRMFPTDKWRFELVEVVKWYDCNEPFGGAHFLQSDIAHGRDYLCTQEIGVNILWPVPNATK